MCQHHAKKPFNPVLQCKPDKTSSGPDVERYLETNADLCWKDIEPMFEDCGFKNKRTVSNMVRDEIYKPAIKSAPSTDDEQTRLKRIINNYVKHSISTDETKDKYHCIVDALMDDFKPGVTLTDEEANNAAIRMADRLVELMHKLAKNAIPGFTPGNS